MKHIVNRSNFVYQKVSGNTAIFKVTYLNDDPSFSIFLSLDYIRMYLKICTNKENKVELSKALLLLV
jgi:hypothetical protein